VPSLADVATPLAETCASEIGRSTELMIVTIDRTVERLNDVKILIIRALEKRNQMTELLGRRDASPDVLDTLVAELASDLHTVGNIFEDDKWGAAGTLRESTRLSDLATRSGNELARVVRETIRDKRVRRH
jgi:hypothetical protein